MWVPIGVKYGIPTREFYGLNPKLILRYQPYLAKIREKQAEDAHFDGWVHGQYVGAAIGANFSKRAKYPHEPFYQMVIEDDSEEERYVMTDADRFEAWALTFNAGHKNLDVVDGNAKEIDVVESD